MSEEARDAIREFLTTQLARRSGHALLADGDDVIASGVVDSLGIQLLVPFLETTFRIEIGDHEILPENFASVDAIAGFVVRRRAALDARSRR